MKERAGGEYSKDGRQVDGSPAIPSVTKLGQEL